MLSLVGISSQGDPRRWQGKKKKMRKKIAEIPLIGILALAGVLVVGATYVVKINGKYTYSVYE